ncbi:HAD hydrolase-like protein [Clostridium polynesiense]|uniref:HAD hydrolase-like protein n=1 Tax=Clostridium polynesiense TaxID=1325933 RepID=UPI000A4F4F10|nr:HAD hydrolase-like protein [Clostridium polynesiense]
MGDSLSSDIKGGNNAGIATCWFNPKGLKNETDIKCSYEIQDLSQLLDIVK